MRLESRFNPVSNCNCLSESYCSKLPRNIEDAQHVCDGKQDENQSDTDAKQDAQRIRGAKQDTQCIGDTKQDAHPAPSVSVHKLVPNS